MLNVFPKKSLNYKIKSLTWFLANNLEVHSLQATSAIDGCSDAKLVDDGNGCPLSNLLASWYKSGHIERSFEQCPVF